MPTFSATKAYADDSALTEAALDNFKTGLETFFNTGIDSDNIKTAGINTVNLVDGSITLDKLTTEVTTRFVPAGTILAWYSYDLTAATPLSFSTAVYAYCDGATAVTVAGFTGTVSVPDMSDRYLIGFGTEGGKDIDTATWATVAVGNVSHSVTFSHTHTGTSHTHGVGTLSFATGSATSGVLSLFSASGSLVAISQEEDLDSGGTVVAKSQISGNLLGTGTGTGVSGAGGTGATGIGGATAHDIQPRSIRVRYLIRIA